MPLELAYSARLWQDVYAIVPPLLTEELAFFRRRLLLWLRLVFHVFLNDGHEVIAERTAVRLCLDLCLFKQLDRASECCVFSHVINRWGTE